MALLWVGNGDGAMPSSAQWIAQRRQRAREAGACISCCTRKPDFGRSTCSPCNVSAIERVRRNREKNKKAAGSERIFHAHERAGDIAGEHHFYDGAAQHYKDALAADDIEEADRLRLFEKLAYALFYGKEPAASIPWLQRALPRYLADPKKAAKAVQILSQLLRQSWVSSEANGGATLVLDQLTQIANAVPDPHLQKLAKLRMLSLLRIRHHSVEAENVLRAIGTVTSEDDPILRCGYHLEKAILGARRGEATQAYKDFENAVRIAQEEGDFYKVTVIWSLHAGCAIDLGDMRLGKACLERALFIARQNRIVWRIAYQCLYYADVLAKIGEYEEAYGFLREALSYNARAPKVDEMFAIVGIPLALHMKDHVMLTKCASAPVIKHALQSDQPLDLGAVVSIAEMYAVQGQRRTSQLLLRRAIKRLADVNFDGLWEFPLTVARYGAMSDVERARKLFEERLHLPCASTVRACLRLFDAFVAQRTGKITQSHVDAAAAVEQLDALHWYGYSDMARALLPEGSRLPRRVVVPEKPFVNMQPTLTEREQQVAELVLKGLSNRAIAEHLSIKERTVETHMTSIMNRLGLRSRYQLVGALSVPEL